jgi:hypothetical protein
MLKKFIIERTIPGVGGRSPEQIRELASKSNSVLAQLGPKIQWKESYVTDDKIFSVYIAENQELIKEHARIGGFPVDKITEVKMVMDPTTDNQETYKIREKQNQVLMT